MSSPSYREADPVEPRGREVEVVAGAFRGFVSAALRADELQSFRDAIKRLDDSLQGEAVLSSMEDWLNLRITVDRAGHLEVSGNVSDRPGVGNQLTFTIDGLDQSYLRHVLEGLDAILAAFPVVGSP
jgi:hypothetical protein